MEKKTSHQHHMRTRTFFFSASEKLRGCDRGLKENDGAQIQKWRCVCACCSTPCLLVLADASGGHVDVKPITVDAQTIPHAAATTTSATKVAQALIPSFQLLTT